MKRQRNIASHLRWAVILAAVLFSLTTSAKGPPGGAFAITELTIESGDERHVFRVEVADTQARRVQGLQGRAAMDRDAGMLFVFDAPVSTAMWMKNTHIPLDMLFIEAAGNISRIVEHTTPLSLTPIPSQAPVKAVLELAGGTVSRLGIKPGDKIVSTWLARE